MVAATVGGGLVAVVRELFTKKSKDKQDSSLEHVLITSLQQDTQERRDLLRQLVQANSDTAFSLKEMTMLNKFRENRTEELHKSTHGKLEEITSNQNKIHEAIVKGLSELKQAA
jgi:FixJ family two-component response regulator